MGLDKFESAGPSADAPRVTGEEGESGTAPSHVGLIFGFCYAVIAWMGVGVVLNCGGDMCGVVAIPIMALLLPFSPLLLLAPEAPPNWPGIVLAIFVVLANAALITWVTNRIAARLGRRRNR